MPKDAKEKWPEYGSTYISSTSFEFDILSVINLNLISLSWLARDHFKVVETMQSDISSIRDSLDRICELVECGLSIKQKTDIEAHLKP